MSQTAPRSTPFTRYDVCVRGGGIVGMTLALLLARERLRVALLATARPPDAPTDVRAYALNNAARGLLQSLKVWPADEPDASVPPDTIPAVTPVLRMAVHGDEGGRLGFSASEQGVEALSWIVDVPALERRLSDAVGFQSGIDRVSEAVPAALTVVCEGKRSHTRDALGMEFEVHPYPHKAIAARVLAQRPHEGVARQWFVQGDVLALLPMGGPQGNLLALVWSLPSAASDHWLAAEPDALMQAVQTRCDQALGTLSLCGPAQSWPLELSRAARWITRTAQGSVVLAGDAAHAMHPLAGQGLNVGLADVAELARVIREREYWRELGDPKLLRRYERARQADVSAMGWLTDGLFGLFSQPDTRVQALRNWGMSGVDRLGPLKHWLARRAMGNLS